MSSDGFRTDLAGLTERAGEFAEHASRADRVATTLREAVESAAACWGADEIGQRFAARHREPADAALRTVEDVAARLRETGEKFADTAEETRRTDAANGEELHRLAGEG